MNPRQVECGRKNGKVLVSPAAAPTRTKTLRKGISVFKEQSQARALGQPVSLERLKVTGELSAPPGTGFSTMTRELDTSWWIQVFRQPRARASSARDEARLSIPSGGWRGQEPRLTGPKNKKSRNRHLAFI
jgi:hypothetical protein